MKLSLDTKPIGAFIEYTLKPLVDDSRELIELLEKHDLKLGNIIRQATFLYVFNTIVNFITSVTVTGLICYTALRLLNSHLIPA